MAWLSSVRLFVVVVVGVCYGCIVAKRCEIGLRLLLILIKSRILTFK